jgi:hypothetical protein
MTTKKKATPKAEGRMEARPAEAPKPAESKAKARMALLPSVNAAAVVSLYAKPIGIDDQDIASLMDCLADEVKDVWAGDMKRAEAMLYGQAQALQSIFMALARRATTQEYLKQWEGYLRMALKAQNQCRMTLETLATIKNPPVVFARQANINNGGQQQVNNEMARQTVASRTRETRPEKPNELSETNHELLPDVGASPAASEAGRSAEVRSGKTGRAAVKVTNPGLRANRLERRRVARGFTKAEERAIVRSTDVL